MTGREEKCMKSIFRNELTSTFKKFREPWDIQKFLNDLKYSTDYGCRSPMGVATDNIAHCSEGAFFAAAALRYLGFKPIVIILFAKNDDDHLIAPFKKNNYWGSIAKSNTTMLRYREPVYKSIRELVMSYFDMYFNIKGEKGLRRYSETINMKKFDKYDWMHADNLDFIWDLLEKVKTKGLLNNFMIKNLRPADKDMIEACFRGSEQEGVFKPK
jgi:hypothetical protein